MFKFIHTSDWHLGQNFYNYDRSEEQRDFLRQLADIVRQQEPDALLISGDTIFYGSVGRTDLWGGDMAQLINSIREKILTLPDETVIASGHGPTTTVADEKRINPFL